MGVVLLAAAMLTAGGCGGMVKPLMVYSPNHGWEPDVEPGEVHEGPSLWGIDREMYVRAGPPEALLRVWIMEPDVEALGEDDEPRGTILVLHGFRNQAFWMRDKAERFAEAGYRAVLVDLRGHGGSSGAFITYGALESRDLVQVADALEDQGLMERPLGVWGISMGGSTAIQWAGRDDRVKAVVAVAPYTRMAAVVPAAVRTLLPVGGWFMSDEKIRSIMQQAAREAGFDPSEADAVRAIQRTEAPVLILHGSWDAIVPYEHGERLHEAAPERSELVKLELTGHIGAHFSGEAADRAVGWFEAHLTEADAATEPGAENRDDPESEEPESEADPEAEEAVEEAAKTEAGAGAGRG